MKARTIRIAPVALAAALTLAFAPAGAALVAEPDQALAGTAWRLSSLGGEAPLAGSEITLRFGEGNRISGTDGCNRLAGDYEQRGASLRVGESLSVTRRSCPGPVMAQADAFRDALLSAREAVLQDTRLSLLDAERGVLAEFIEQPAGIEGTSWRVTGYNNGRQAVVSVLQGTELTLAFGADSLSGSAGCNRFRGDYAFSGERLETGEIVATRKMCARPEGVMHQEAAYLAALGRADVVQREGSRLELRSDEGALQVRAVLESEAAGKAMIGGLELPATFRGDLPCADCEAIRYHLDLWPDHVFHLRRTWLGRRDHGSGDGDADFSSDDIGRWRVDEGSRMLVLQGGAEVPLRFEIKGSRTLRATDVHGAPIESKLPYELVTDGSLHPTDVRMLLGGEFRYMADAPLFRECLTGRSYPVAMEGDYIELERAYLAAEVQPGSPLYATLEGQITRRPRMEGEGTEPAVVVDRFINVWPTESCERSRADASLVNTYWRIESLGEMSVDAVEGAREPHLLLRSVDDSLEYRATVGCNHLSGSYSLNEGAIRFAPGPSTLMACPPPLDAWERALVSALSQARAWQVEGNTLELFDESGKSIALLRAVYF
ncbi:MAG: META domain-containing protein [Gammaproteobacteria bacterium]